MSALARSGIVSQACRAAEVSRRTAYNWHSRSPKFREQWDQALDDAVDYLEGLALQKCEAGSDSMIQFMLKAARPAKYRERYLHDLPTNEHAKFALAKILGVHVDQLPDQL